jgi:hypothetical protein
MITKLSDEILREYTDEEIAEYIRSEQSGADISTDAVAYYIAALRMDENIREQVFRLFASAPLLCRECGRPSCLHGYSDE